jgi:hypothetical protein
LELEKQTSDKGKSVVLELMGAYFEVLWLASKATDRTTIATLSALFTAELTKKRLDKVAKPLMGSHFENARDRYFYPALFTYFVQLLEIYDQALQGKQLASYIKQLDKMRKVGMKGRKKKRKKRRW